MGFGIFFFLLDLFGFVLFFEKEFQAGLKLTTKLMMSLNFGPSWLYLPSAKIILVHHHAWFMEPELCPWQTSPLTTQSRGATRRLSLTAQEYLFSNNSQYIFHHINLLRPTAVLSPKNYQESSMSARETLWTLWPRGNTAVLRHLAKPHIPKTFKDKPHFYPKKLRYAVWFTTVLLKRKRKERAGRWAYRNAYPTN